MRLAQNLAALLGLRAVAYPTQIHTLFAKDRCRSHVSEPLQGEGGHAGLRGGLS
jgi:hypothetical protein